MTSSRALWLVIVAATLVRLGFGWGIGLGIDESYMVTAGRGPLQIGYFDHPLVSWWMSQSAARLFGSEAAVVVRLPFIALFALSTWLMARITTVIASPRAGLRAAIAFNLSPVFGVTTGGWVLPDGPLIAALLGAVLCLLRALEGGRWSWWIGAGLCVGLAMLSKYTAVLSVAGVVLFLALHRAHRVWLARPQPYVAGGLALLVFSPVVIWNAEHGWASLAFQGGRAAAAVFRPFGPLLTLGGEAAFLLPWIWAGLMLAGWIALRRGNWRARLLVCLAAPPVVLFAVVSFWSRQVLFHWASPGYVMLFPLLGAYLAERTWAPRAAWTTAAVLGLAMLLVVSEVRLAWLPVAGDPGLQSRDWTALRAGLPRTDLPVAATSWSDAGKVGIGLGPDVPVYCLNVDAREFRFSTRPPVSGDVLIIAPRRSLADMRTAYGGNFADISALPPVRVGATDLPVYIGHGLRRWPAPSAP